MPRQDESATARCPSDRQSFEDAAKGFIAPLSNPGVIKNAKGDVVWNLPDFKFLAGNAAARTR
jgi:alkyl sulfatase BDS1-like metallo-beta-lactamase superfamily hydrolase